MIRILVLKKLCFVKVVPLVFNLFSLHIKGNDEHEMAMW
jgi:hypothetical protein